MKFVDRYSKAFQFLLPTPLSIAFVLTFITFLTAYFFTGNTSSSDESYAWTLMTYWENGLWNNGLMVFAMQMMLMLVLGHVLALTPFVEKFIRFLCRFATTNAKAAALITFFTLLVSFFNWGLGLIFGAIISRKVGEQASRLNMPLNYPLIGAAGYSGLMFWHGGVSGSSLTKVAESGHLKSMMEGIASPDQLAKLPEHIGFDETVFSDMNVVCSLLILLLIPLLMFFLGKKVVASDLSFLEEDRKQKNEKRSNPEPSIGAERIDHSNITTKLIGIIIIGYLIYKVSISESYQGFSFITPNFINLSLIGLGVALHKNIISFLTAIEKAISGASGILIQFPLYFGIMGIMKSSGLVQLLSNFFVEISTEQSFPLFTLISAGIVNVFVPSGGGQWAVQGPIIVQAAEALNVSLPKSIMALAYGDQLTNMLQPFWALPLLGITKLKAKEILPYTLILMLGGSIVYFAVLLLF